ncbi:MAG: hypothetical protein ACR2IT_09955 [Pirellulales bacterium]
MPSPPCRLPSRRRYVVVAACLMACLAVAIARRALAHGDPFGIDYAAGTNRLTVSPTVYDVFNVDENLATPGFGFPISTIYPGFSRADTLPVSSALSLRFTSTLHYWNPGTGLLDPLPFPSGTISVVSRSAAMATVAATEIGGVNPLFVDTFVGAPGEHHHFTAYELTNPDAPGLYGLWAEATATGPGYPVGGTIPSDPFLIVLNWGIEDEQQYQDGVARLSAFNFTAPGDTNLDWQVDVLDAANVLTAGKFDTGAPATWAEGDFNDDGVVDVLDTAEFLSSGLYNTGFYRQPPGSVGAVAVVPEPSTWLLAGGWCIGCRALLRRRARRLA